jgi:hypothetical protein
MIHTLSLKEYRLVLGLSLLIIMGGFTSKIIKLKEELEANFNFLDMLHKLELALSRQQVLRWLKQASHASRHN